MTNTSINISGKLDQPTIELYRAVDEAAQSVGSAYLVVGASARDLLLQHGYGMRVVRATADTDFGVQVSGWEQYEGMRRWLINEGFRETRRPHRLVSPNELTIDIVPFGEIENEQSNISWPPDGSVVMNVLGFADALNSAVDVCISEEPELHIPIASATGLALLKVIAWTDRPIDIRAKDAKDLIYLAHTYEKLPYVDPHEDAGLLERFNFDITQVGAYLLGKDTCLICGEPARHFVSQLLLGKMEGRRFENLIDDSLESRITERGQSELTLSAFLGGFLEGH